MAPSVTHRIAFRSFGVLLCVDVAGEAHLRPRLVAAIEAILPPGHERVPARPLVQPAAVIVITAHHDQFRVLGAGGLACTTHRVEHDALHAVDRAIRAVVSLHAPEHVFIHAGVVSGPSGAVVIPGRSFTGKTTLVGALVEAGATYLSDEYAVLTPAGSVLPYPRSLTFRTPSGRTDVPPERLGDVATGGPAPVELVLSTWFVDGADWAPAVGSQAACALALLDNSVAARTRPHEVLSVVATVARSARFLHGERGPADVVARRVCDDLGAGGRPLPR